MKTDDTIDTKLAVLNTFNIQTRYEDYKNEFYNMCNKEYADEQLEIIKEVRKWLKKLLIEQ